MDRTESSTSGSTDTGLSTSNQSEEGITSTDESERSRNESQISQLSPEVLKHSSNPNIVLTNPVVLSHLRRLHDRATQRDDLNFDENEDEQKDQMMNKIEEYNKRITKAAFRISMGGADKLSFSGAIIFHYKGAAKGEENKRLMLLKDTDTVKDIMPALRDKFELAETVRATIRQQINGDEILLDPDDRPLDLAVNANSAVTFNIVAGTDRTAEVLHNLESGNFTPLQRRKLMEKFNIDDDIVSSSDFGGASRTSQSSASESTGKCDSLEGSPIRNGKSRSDRLRASLSNTKLRTGNQRKSNSNNKEIQHLQNGKDALRKNENPTQILSVNTIPRRKNDKTEIKSGKNAQPVQRRQGRETVSASARKLFSSIRKNGRGRSASRERGERTSPVKSNPTPVTPPQGDLSSDAHLPGILKIFGDAVSPGANYKSVLATRQSIARELVKAALERYGVSRNLGRKYVLCEVVGRLKVQRKSLQSNTKNGRVEYSVVVSHQEEENSKNDILDESFVEEYARPLSDHEKPLILQSYWKPLEGYVRRFELRERSQIFDQMGTEKDTQTKHVNAQAKRIVMKNARLSRTQSSLNIKTLNHDASSSDEDNDAKEYGKKITKEENNNILEHVRLPTPPQFADDKATTNGDVETLVPFLITLQGEDGVSSDSGNERGGSVVHYLDRKVTVIGRTQVEPTSEGEPVSESTNDINIRLSDDEIKHHHCVIYRVKQEEETDAQKTNGPWKVTLHLVADDCIVTVNGQAVESDKKLSNGDIISIGSKYIFMLKDPTSKSNLSSNMRLTVGTTSAGSNHNSIASRGSAFTPVKKRYVECEINYRPEFEDHVLDVIFAAANDILSTSSSKVQSEKCERELAPARFFIHCIEQACFNFNSEQKRSLLFVIATNLQTILLDATGSVSLQDDAKIKNPQEGINYILPKLEDVVFWMSNALEIFSYLQADMVDRVSARVKQELERNEIDNNLLNDASSFRATDDILAVLEEVVMYAFQQLVYYLTKTLYGALPTVLDTNPFAETNENSEDAVRGTGHVIAIYDAALRLTRKYGVHSAIESQLFAYLFFFTNVSLFNTLMEEDASSKYYRWDKGVQIRGNLEEIECWANDNGFQQQATEFLLKFSTLTNLLATTKTQMLQSTWSNFRRDFPQLHPVQLKQILDGYVLGPRVNKKPADWIPDSEDLEESTEEEFILESYDNHPPLVLPTHGTQLNLNEPPTEPWYKTLRDVILAVGQGCEIGSLKLQDTWTVNPNHCFVGERPQPDGHELSPGQLRYVHSSLSSSSTSSMTGRHHESNYKKKSLTQSDILQAVKLSVQSQSPSTTSMSSMMSDSTSHSLLGEHPNISNIKPMIANSHIPSPVPAPRRVMTPTPAPRSPRMQDNRKHEKKSVPKYATLDRPSKKNKRKSNSSGKPLTDDQSCNYNSLVENESFSRYHEGVENVLNKTNSDSNDDLRVLPIQTTFTKCSEIETSSNSLSYTTSPSSDGTNDSFNQVMPNEVFIVDVVKGRKGLGLGLVDGMYTSLQVSGVFVRSLVPDGPSVKHVRMKHQEVIKCWLQDGRLQLGDRILAVNGTSLISMNYTSVMEELRKAGDKMRFLVGRSGPEVAIKITSSSC